MGKPITTEFPSENLTTKEADMLATYLRQTKVVDIPLDMCCPAFLRAYKKLIKILDAQVEYGGDERG